MELKDYCLYLEEWLKHQLTITGMKGYILGMSGGIDSALVGAIAQKAVGEKLFCVVMPCESHENDAKDAYELMDKLGIQYVTVDLTETYRVMAKNLSEEAAKAHFELDALAYTNLKVRLRMCTLYAYAQAKRSLVLGTDNWDESYTGYFTKYGDGGVDLLPIVSLTKGEVREAAKLYGVTETILKRKPSAGLFEGQTDEKEMGVTYDELDAFLLGEQIDLAKKERIEHLHKVSEHKRNPIPTPNKFGRN